MAEPARALRIFLCHAHSDHDMVNALYTRLIRAGLDVWLGQKNIARSGLGIRNP